MLVAQAAFFSFFLLLYLLSSRTAHRLVGYFEAGHRDVNHGFADELRPRANAATWLA